MKNVPREISGPISARRYMELAHANSEEVRTLIEQSKTAAGITQTSLDTRECFQETLCLLSVARGAGGNETLSEDAWRKLKQAPIREDLQIILGIAESAMSARDPSAQETCKRILDLINRTVVLMDRPLSQ